DRPRAQGPGYGAQESQQYDRRRAGPRKGLRHPRKLSHRPRHEGRSVGGLSFDRAPREAATTALAAEPRSFGEIDQLLLAARRVRGGVAGVAAVGVHQPLAAVGLELELEDGVELTPQLRIFDWHQDLDATFKVACHRVGRTDEVLLIAAVAKVIDAAMFEKAPDDTDHADVVRETFDTGTQPASIADDQLDPHTRHRSAVERSR